MGTENAAGQDVPSIDWLAKPFTYTFDEHGGYDCMTSAYSVKNGNGKRLFTIDCSDYGQKHCHNGPHKDAEAVAKGICEMANDQNQSEGATK